MPSPPISTLACFRPVSRSAARTAIASSDPLSREFISSIRLSEIENSAPRRLRRKSPPPGTVVWSRCCQGIIGVACGWWR